MVDGDTLEGIALKLWGDASYWYLIAEVNGLTGGEALVAGQNLSIPNKVHNAHNSSDVYRVYDPNEIIGSTSPTNPKAPKGKGNKCGAFGQILLIAVAVAVTAVTAGGAAAAIMSGVQGGILGGLGALATAGVAGAAGATLGIGTAIAIGAGAAALGSVVSQGLGVATGIQDKFSFKGVALAALAGGAAVGLAGVSPFGGTGAFANLANFAARGALGSVLSQGIGVATGLQNRFSFANVATAGIGAAVGGAIGGHTSLGRAGAGMAGGIAAAAGESLITGNSFGDTLMRSLPSIIGNTIGNLAAEGIASAGKPRTGNTIGVPKVISGNGMPMLAAGASMELVVTTDLPAPGSVEEAQAMRQKAIDEVNSASVSQSAKAEALGQVDANFAPYLDPAHYGAPIAAGFAADLSLAAEAPGAEFFSQFVGEIGTLRQVTGSNPVNQTAFAFGGAIAVAVGYAAHQRGPQIFSTPAQGPMGPSILSTPAAGRGPTILSTPAANLGGPHILSTPMAGGSGPQILSTPIAGPAGPQILANSGIGTADDFGIPKSLSPRQGLHISPVTDGRSVLTADPAELLKGLHAGDFKILRNPKPGQVVVDFNAPIGEYWSNGIKVGQTQFGSVSYGKKGAHIIPANPKQW